MAFLFSLFFAAQKSSFYYAIPLLLLAVMGVNIKFFFLTKIKQNTAPIIAPLPAKSIHEVQKEDVVHLPVSSNQEQKLGYEAVIDNIGEGLVVIDNEGKITTFNKAAELLLGWSEKDALGKNLSEVIKIDYESDIKLSSESTGNRSTLHFIRKDQTKFPASITTSSYIQGEKILGTITLFRDLTAERNIDTMKNEFISLASHQLRTPLAAIKWYSKMLLSGDAGKLLPEQTQYVDSIYSSTEHMIALVNSLLNITRIESGRIMVEPTPTDIKNLVTEVINEVKIRYMDKKQTFTVHLDDAIPAINLDPRLIRQVYVNLLTNAAKYTPEKGEIVIRVSKNEKDVVSEIRDNGFGIPESEKDKVFGKFYRGKNMINGDNKGTGLGLYLAKAIVELSHGKIWYESKEGKGTTFWLSIPLAGTPAKTGVLTIET